MTFANITTGVVNKAIYAFGDMKKDGPYLENAIKRTEENGKVTYEIPSGAGKSTKPVLEIIRDSSKQKTINFNLSVRTRLKATVDLTYSLKENNKKELFTKKREVWEYSVDFGMLPLPLANNKNIFLPFIEKALNREPDSTYKRYLQKIYDEVKAAE